MWPDRAVLNGSSSGFTRQPGTATTGRSCFQLPFWMLVALAASLFSVLRWGGQWLVSADLVPGHLDEAVVLQGSTLGEKARMAGAVKLLREQKVDRILLSIPKETYWGQMVAPIARDYVGKTFGSEIAGRLDFCETSPEVNSTRDEAEELVGCIRQRGWKSIAVVTSDYHTRRTGIIWRRILRRQASPFNVWVHGVTDPEFLADQWWGNRRSAKTWMMESVKLVDTLIER